MSILEKTKGLRSEAWAGLKESPDFKAFKALDDAVVALGGVSEMPSDMAERRTAAARIANNAIRRMDTHRRVTQAIAAEKALRAAGEPLPIGRLLEGSIAQGAKVSGSDPLSNFRSTMSRDERFTSLTRNNMYFWWFANEALPEDWNEAPDLPLEHGSDASSQSSSREGGDGDAATKPN